MSDKTCATCDWFALEPRKRKSGACFKRWMPEASYGTKGTATIGAYGRVFPWEYCECWVPKGTLERLEPMRIGDDQ